MQVDAYFVHVGDVCTHSAGVGLGERGLSIDERVLCKLLCNGYCYGWGRVRAGCGEESSRDISQLVPG